MLVIICIMRILLNRRACKTQLGLSWIRGIAQSKPDLVIHGQSVLVFMQVKRFKYQDIYILIINIFFPILFDFLQISEKRPPIDGRISITTASILQLNQCTTSLGTPVKSLLTQFSQHSSLFFYDQHLSSSRDLNVLNRRKGT